MELPVASEKMSLTGLENFPYNNSGCMDSFGFPRFIRKRRKVWNFAALSFVFCAVFTRTVGTGSRLCASRPFYAYIHCVLRAKGVLSLRGDCFIASLPPLKEQGVKNLSPYALAGAPL